MKNKAEIQKLAEALRKEIGDYSQLSVALETLVPNGSIDYDNEGQVIFYTDVYPASMLESSGHWNWNEE